MWQEWGLPCKHAVAVLKRRNLDLYKFSHDNWRLEKHKEMFEMMGALITVKESGYELNPNLKPPKHGPYETVVDKTTGKEKIVCVCIMCTQEAVRPKVPQHAQEAVRPQVPQHAQGPQHKQAQGIRRNPELLDENPLGFTT